MRPTTRIRRWVLGPLGSAAPLGRELILSTTGVGGLKIAHTLLSFVSVMLLARFLGPDGYGQYAFIISSITLLAHPFSRGIPNLLIREIAEYERQAAWGYIIGILRRSHQLIALISILLIISFSGLYLIRPGATTSERWLQFALAAPIFPLLAISTTNAAVLRGFRKAVWGNSVEFVGRPLAFLAAILVLLAADHLTPTSAISGQLAATVFAFIMALILLKRIWPDEATHAEAQFDTRRWFGSWIPFTLIAAIGIANNQITVVLLGFLSSETEVGYFRVAFVISTLIVFPLIVINSVIAPHISRLYYGNDQARLQKLAMRATRYAGLSGAMIGVSFVVGSSPLMGLIFGQGYEPAYYPLVILVVGQVCNAFVGPVALLLNMSGYERSTAAIAGLGLAINLIVAVFAIPKLEALGGALAVTLAMLFTNVILYFRVRKILGIHLIKF